MLIGCCRNGSKNSIELRIEPRPRAHCGYLILNSADTSSASSASMMEVSAPTTTAGERIAERFQQRAAAAAAAKAAKLSSTAPSSATSRQSQIEAFNDSFNRHHSVVTQTLATPPLTDDQFTLVSDTVAAMRALLSTVAEVLPPYDLRQSTNTINAVESAIQQAKHGATPKRAFAFRKKDKTSAATTNAADVATKIAVSTVVAAAPVAPLPTVDAVDDSVVTAAELNRFTHHTGARLYKSDGAVTNGDMTLSHLTECVVVMTDPLRALRCSHLNKCTIAVGLVNGSVHIDHCTDSTIIVRAHQIRIHHTNKTLFHLYTISKPIIEYSNDCIFDTYYTRALLYPTQTSDVTNNNKSAFTSVRSNCGDTVADFGWLKAIASPNWRVSTQEEIDKIIPIVVTENERRNDMDDVIRAKTTTTMDTISLTN